MEKFFKAKHKELKETFKDCRDDIKFKFPELDLQEVELTGSRKVFKIIKKV